MSSAHTRMCQAIDAMHASDIEALPLEAALRIASNTELERTVSAIRTRAERAFAVLIRDADGLPPRNKADRAWLAQFDEVQQ